MATYNSFKRIATDSFVANTITSSDISSNAITNGKLATNSVTAAKIVNGAVGTTQLASTVDLSTKTVTYRPIQNGDISGSASIAGSKLASGAAVENIGYTPLSSSGGTMTGSLSVPAGGSTLPSVALSGNTNTGLYFGSNEVLITTNGTMRGWFDASGRLRKGPDSSTRKPSIYGSTYIRMDIQ